MFVAAQNAPNSASNAESSTKQEIDSKSSEKIESKIESSEKKDEDFFAPSKVSDDTFGSFVVGYQMFFKHGDELEKYHGIFFSLDRGWEVWKQTAYVGLSLDGSAGNFYSLNLNVKSSFRTLDGRLVPSVSLGYGLINHKQNSIQHNLHGASASVGLFVDIFRGIGLEASYRVGLHKFPALKDRNIKRGVQSFMINLKFIDFSI